VKRLIKNTGIFFLLLAGLAVSAHMIIPHDHHIGDSSSGQEDSCPFSSGKTDHHKGFPIHCHAFNDLASEKIVISLLPVIDRQNYLAIITLFDPFAFVLKFHSPPDTEYWELIPEPFLLEFSSLRAPPVLS
jgi:hypothetical protein